MYSMYVRVCRSLSLHRHPEGSAKAEGELLQIPI